MQQNASKRLPYPPATGAYKVFIKGKSTWQDHKTARLHISMGNPKQDGEKLQAMTEWLSHRFDKVILIVSDTLQRHNIAFECGISPEKAWGAASMQGRDWLERNKWAIELISQPVVTLWNEWLSHSDYKATRAELDALYAQDAALKEAVNAKARQFCEGMGISPKDFPFVSKMRT